MSLFMQKAPILQLSKYKMEFSFEEPILRNIPVLVGKLSAFLLDAARLEMCFPSRA